MKEKDFQTSFNHWCRRYWNNTAVFELKFARGKSLPFDALAEHQENALYASKHNKVIHKIPDAGYQNPFDSFVLVGVEAYVVVAFENIKNFYLIDIDQWQNIREEAERKSLTEDMAKENGRHCTSFMV